MSRVPKLRFLLILTVAVLLAAASVPVEAVASHQWIVTSELQLHNVGSTRMERIRVRAPMLAQITAYGEVVDEQFSVSAENIEMRDDGAREVTFVIPELAPGAEMTLTIQYTIDPNGASSLSGEETAEPEPVANELDAELAAAARRVIRGVEGRDAKFSALQRFTHNHMNYDLQSPWRNGDAAQALERAEGVCEDYSLLLVALAEAAGIPARPVYGYVRSQNADEWTRHTWVEYRTEDGHWVAADPTYSTSPGLNGTIEYVAQWYEDRSTRVSHVGGRIAGSLSETVQRVEIEDSE